MNRRSFLTLASLGAAGMVLDPERLLWVPGQKTFVFVSQPIRKPSLSEIVAATWDKVIAEHGGYDRIWCDEAMLRYFKPMVAM